MDVKKIGCEDVGWVELAVAAMNMVMKLRVP
jgi:hypothetical protein